MSEVWPAPRSRASASHLLTVLHVTLQVLTPEIKMVLPTLYNVNFMQV